MYESFIKILPQLGVGVVAVLSLVYTVIKLTRWHKEERQQNQEVFMEFINNNNHTMTELVKESTVAIKECSNNIKESTKALIISNNNFKK